MSNVETGHSLPDISFAIESAVVTYVVAAVQTEEFVAIEAARPLIIARR